MSRLPRIREALKPSDFVKNGEHIVGAMLDHPNEFPDQSRRVAARYYIQIEMTSNVGRSFVDPRKLLSHLVYSAVPESAPRPDRHYTG
jgi:hypothetical protein